MASKSLISWGVGLLLAASIMGCNSGTANQGGGGQCADPAHRACTIDGILQCTNVSVDANNCGACGTTCGAKACINGACMCGSGLTECNSGCVNYQTDAKNCGNCGKACEGSTPFCSNGTCTASCPSDQRQCGNSCTNTASDMKNCGDCGKECPSNATSCSNGVCQVPSGNNGTGGSTSAGGASSQGGSNPGNGGQTNSTSTSTSKGGSSSTSSGQGGASTGGTSSTGSNTGGTSSTNTSAGGTSSTSTGQGGTSTGGTSTGTATGGSTSSSTGGTTSSGDAPKGYYYTADWGVSKVDWHGCAWTGIDTVSDTTTSITPQDFTSVARGGPYQVTGKVNKAYEAVALLGFNISEAIGSDPNQCKYDSSKATADGPPGMNMATITATTKGLAINWTAKTKPGQFRVQLQEADCASNLGHCYCATIADATGPSFVPWTDFYAYCWNHPERVDTTNPAAVQYAGSDIDAIVFSVPGNGTADTAFDFTVVGFAPGEDEKAAPGGVIGCGEQTGTLGNGGPSEDASMQRMAVTDSNCKKYVAFNNNWGQPTSTSQIIDFVGNSFTVKSSQAAVSGQGVPGSFPSLYIGANGDLGGGTFNTWSDSGLPKKISAIGSAPTSFTWSGGTSGGDYNATYDVWFSANSPTAGSYNDAISGFLMVWLYKPSSRSPIGSVRRQANVAGKDWDVWVGPRGVKSDGTDDANRPVVSYVAKSTLQSLTFDLKDFMNDAVTNGDKDKTAGQTSQAFIADWYLTDVFAGFEIWSGSAATNLKETFTCEIK